MFEHTQGIRIGDAELRSGLHLATIRTDKPLGVIKAGSKFLQDGFDQLRLPWLERHGQVTENPTLQAIAAGPAGCGTDHFRQADIRDLRMALCRSMLESMAFPKLALLPVAFALTHLAVSQQPAVVKRTLRQNGMPSSGGYEPPSSSMTHLLESDHAMNEALMNRHGTHYTVEDSTRFHALARSQGFDVEAISVTCYKRVPAGSGITLGRLPGLIVGEQPKEPFTPEELKALDKAGITGSLLYGGGSEGGDSVLLMRPEGPRVNVRIILDHDPGSEVLLPMPAHHDAIYAQRGDEFLAFPNGGNVMPRYINLEPQTQDTPQVSVFIQAMDGGHSGGFCNRFPIAHGQ